MLQLQRFAKPEPVRRYAPDTPEQLERVIEQLLAKEPSERFPNTQVLARHLQAMYKALTRPAADDFALTGERAPPVPGEGEWDCSLAAASTRAETDDDPQPAISQMPRPAGGEVRDSVSPSQEAVTLAVEDGPGGPGSRAAPSRPRRSEPGSADQPFTTTRPAHFTTVEEEEARRQEEQKRSWILVAVQLAALAALLAGMSGLAYYLSRPRSADELYRTIAAAAADAGENSLAAAEREIDEFLARFPDDLRTAELKPYQERIILDKMESRLQRRARSGQFLDSALLPVETLYLRAGKLADESPEEAIAMLSSLVDLYGSSESLEGASSGDDEALRQAACVQLAQRRLAALRTEYARFIEQQRALLEERLEAAGRLAADEPHRAAAIYDAIAELHGDDPWAAEIVSEARRRLADLAADD